MSGLDWICLAVLTISLAIGAWRGFLYEVLAIAGWVCAFLAARWAAPVVGDWLPLGESPENVRYAAGFALVFIGVAFLGGMLAWAVRSAAKALGMRAVDRVFGAAFGALRGVALLLLLAAMIGMTPLRQAPWWQESLSAQWLEMGLVQLQPVLPAPFKEYLRV